MECTHIISENANAADTPHFIIIIIIIITIIIITIIIIIIIVIIIVIPQKLTFFLLRISRYSGYATLTCCSTLTFPRSQAMKMSMHRLLIRLRSQASRSMSPRFI